MRAQSISESIFVYGWLAVLVTIAIGILYTMGYIA